MAITRHVGEKEASTDQPPHRPYDKAIMAHQKRLMAMSKSCPPPQTELGWRHGLDTISEEGTETTQAQEVRNDNPTHPALLSPAGLISAQKRAAVHLLCLLAAIWAMTGWMLYCFVERPERSVHHVGTMLVSNFAALVFPGPGRGDARGEVYWRGITLVVVWYTALCLSLRDVARWVS